MKSNFERVNENNRQIHGEKMFVVGKKDEKDSGSLDGYGNNEKKDNVRPNSLKDMTKEEFEAMFETKKLELQKLIDTHKRLFASFAENNSLEFILSDGFYFLPEKGEVHIATEWFLKEGYTNEQIIWACFHELSHFRDMIADPSGFLKNFAYIREQAKKTGKILEKKWIEKYDKSDPKFIKDITKQRPIDKKNPDKGTMSKIEKSAYQMHHRFFNVMDDIYVNNIVRNRAGRYAIDSEADKEVVQRLYKERLFVKNDYSDKKVSESRNAQFINKLLRDEMVLDEKVVVSDEIQDIFNKEYITRGKKYTIQSLIDERLKPIKGEDTTPGARYALLERTLEPIFIELLMKDIEEMKLEKKNNKGGEKSVTNSEEGGNEKGNEGSEDWSDEKGDVEPYDLDPFAKDFPSDKSNPDQFSERDIRDFIERTKKAKDEKEHKNSMTSDERSKYEHKQKQLQWDKDYNITQEERMVFDKIVRKINPYLDNLLGLWKSIAYGKDRHLELHEIGYFRKGKLDVHETVQRFPDIQDASAKGTLENIEVSTRIEQKEVLTTKPELIRISFVGDLSGSMDTQKRKVLKETMTLVLLSLKDFNTYLDRTRKDTKTKLHVDTEAWAFGSSFEQVKKSHNNYALEQTGIIKAVSAVDKDLGGTNDAAVLNHLRERITPKEQIGITTKKIMEIIFEVTDGVPDDDSKTCAEIDALEQQDIIVRGFQIGNVDDSAREIFNSIWNEGRQEPLGTIIGSDISKLPLAVALTLKKYLGNVKV